MNKKMEYRGYTFNIGILQKATTITGNNQYDITINDFGQSNFYEKTTNVVEENIFTAIEALETIAKSWANKRLDSCKSDIQLRLEANGFE
jgi:hypothetical protein